MGFDEFFRIGCYVYEIANKNRFPFPVQKNASVSLMKHPMISKILFLKFFVTSSCAS